MDVLNNCGLNNCGWCRETGGDRDWPGVVEDVENGGEIERDGSLVDVGSSGLGLEERLTDMEGGQEGTGEEEEGAGKDEGNGGEIEREGGLVDGGSSGEAESPCSGLGGDKRLTEMEGGQEGTGKDGGTEGEIEREGSEVDGARATGEEAGGVLQGEGGDPVVVVDDGEGLGGKGR